MVLPCNQPKLSPQTEVWPPALIADTPTTIGSGGYVLMVSCLFLQLFYHIFSYVSIFFYNQVLAVPSRDQPKLSPQTEVWPSALIADTPTTIGMGWYVFAVSF